MKNVLFDLIGIKLKELEVIQDYLQLTFENGVVLNVYNETLWKNSSMNVSSAFKGVEVSAIKETTNAIEIELLDGNSIQIGMSNKDYKGPEALEYIGADGERVVWN